jgi:hypothetical protein
MWRLWRGKRKADEFSSEIEALMEIEAARLRERDQNGRDSQPPTRAFLPRRLETDQLAHLGARRKPATISRLWPNSRFTAQRAA